MVSEVVMYQSMFVLGILVFGFFTVSFNNYSDFAEEVTVENNLQRLVQEVSDQIVRLIDASQLNKDKSDTISVTITLNIESSYASYAYSLRFTQASNGQTYLEADAGEGVDVTATTGLGYLNGTDVSAGEIDFSGILASGDPVPEVTYSYDSTGASPVETVTFS